MGVLTGPRDIIRQTVTMAYCANCGSELDSELREENRQWMCRVCGGRTVSLEMLKLAKSVEFALDLWARVRNGDGEPTRGCPVCRKTMIAVQFYEGYRCEAFEACKSCRFVWLDARLVAFEKGKIRHIFRGNRG